MFYGINSTHVLPAGTVSTAFLTESHFYTEAEVSKQIFTLSALGALALQTMQLLKGKKQQQMNLKYTGEEYIASRKQRCQK